MKMSEIKCDRCGIGLMEAGEAGRYLKRVSPKGETPVVMVCAPNCEDSYGSNDDALLAAIDGQEEI